MATTEEQLKALAARYAAGQCTPEEITRIETWYNSFDEKGAELPPATEISRAADEAAQTAIKHIGISHRQTNIRRIWLPVVKVAAILILMASAGMAIYKALYRPKVVWQQLSAAPGTKKQVAMPDGSVISLNGASSIRYRLPFNEGSREVELKGEAFFNVVHDVSHPFIVHTRQLNVQVLGTSYNIQAYTDESYTKVGVATGKVGVTDRGRRISKAVLLTPGQQLVYSKSGFVKEAVDIASINAWQQDIMEFKGETLEHICRVLARTYGVKFTFKDRTLLQKRFQVKVKKESLTNILKLLSITGKFSYRITGKQVIIG